MTDEIEDDNVVHFDAHLPWQARCQKGARGVMLSNHHNALVALTWAHELRDVFALDEMQQAVVMTHEIGRLDVCDRWVTDNDITAVCIWLQHAGMVHMGTDTTRSAIFKRAQEQAFHPVKDYLRSLMWDGVPRLGTWMTSYLGAELNAYNAHIGRMFLISMAARIIAPGCQVDHMPVLEGEQGILKSSACRVLGGQWFSDHLPDLHTKDASQHLRGKWLIEVPEMHAMGKADATLLKSFITRTTERYRAVWGRVESVEPRQCVFAGTTNEPQYLRDPTGGRRFWPVKVGVSGEIKLALLEHFRDQLFAEAVHAYLAGDPWWPDQQFERELIKPQQEQRFEEDIWEDGIRNFLKMRTTTTVAEIARECLGIPTGQQEQRHSKRIAEVLKNAGWVWKHTNKGNKWSIV